MGGGSMEKDVVRACCVLTFPEELRLEPITLDGWFLYAAGRKYLRQIIKEHCQHLAQSNLLLIVKTVESVDSSEYILCSSNRILRRVLRELYASPDVLFLHILLAPNWKKYAQVVRIRLNVNPNYSPIIIGIEDVVESCTLGCDMSVARSDSTLLSSEMSIGREFFKGVDIAQKLEKSVSVPLEDESVSDTDRISPHHKTRERRDGASGADDERLRTTSDKSSSMTGHTIEASGSVFFLSSSWHVQADVMSASMRMNQSTPQLANSFVMID